MPYSINFDLLYFNAIHKKACGASQCNLKYQLLSTDRNGHHFSFDSPPPSISGETKFQVEKNGFKTKRARRLESINQDCSLPRKNNLQVLLVGPPLTNEL